MDDSAVGSPSGDRANSLKAVPEGSGTGLGNTIILRGCEMDIAHSHSPRDVSYTVIAGRNMGINTGRYLRFERSEPHANCLPASSGRLASPPKEPGANLIAVRLAACWSNAVHSKGLKGPFLGGPSRLNSWDELV